MSKEDSAFICEKVTDLLFEGCDLQEYLCSQGYDGANLMSGDDGGLQAKIKEYIGKNRFVSYTHCPS